ncbi:ATP-binding protein [Pseudomonas sp. F1_0610]|uniref:ATP-binding protein n=1 Tax=Pseudomonas sp. F1_0610 TaxID=3114284 RepID=UPI0039C1F175
MSHLLRIIMIHGHLDGVVELSLDGHTNICGTNASGKTTLQRLVPVFYGELPNKVVPKTRKKFDEFYLPHPTSYLVYEYTREEGNTCQVVLTNSRDAGVEYRFISAPFEPQQYLQETENGLQVFTNEEFASHLRDLKRHSEHFDFSYKIQATSDYRSVIQNDFSQLKNSRDGLKLRQLAAQFSLVKAGHRIRHMEKLVSAVHAKEGKMDTLKTMLAAIFEEDGVVVPVNKLRSSQVREWVQNMRQSMHLDSLRKEFSKVQQLAQALTNTEQQLFALYPLLEKDSALLTEASQQADKEKTQLEAELAQQHEIYDKQRTDLQSLLSQIRSDLQTTQTRLTDLQTRYEHFYETDMQGLELAQKQLPQWRADREQQKQHLQLLRDAVGDSQQQLEARELELAKQLDQFTQRTQAQISQLRERLEQCRTQQEDKKVSLQHEHDAQTQDLQMQFSAQLEQLTQQLSDVAARLSVSALSEAEQNEKAQAQLRLEQEQLSFQQQSKVLTALQIEFQKLKIDQREGLDRLAKVRHAQQKAEQHCQYISKQLDPAEGSLRHFLRGHLDGWENQVGKVLREDLLERTDLSPQLQLTESTQLFNIQLDLSAIELPEYAQAEADLREQLSQAQAVLEQAKEQFKAAENEQATINQKVQEKQTQLDQAKQLQEKYERNIEFAREARDRLEEEHKALLAARRDQLRQQKQQLEGQKQQTLELRKERLAELAHTQKNLLLEFEADWQDERAIFTRQIKQYEQSLLEKREENKRQIKELKEAFDKELEAKQLDPKRLHEQEERISALSQKIEETEQRADELVEYQRFMRTDWAQIKPQLSETEALLIEQQRIEEERLAQLQTCYQGLRNQIRQQVSQQVQILADNDKYQSFIKPLLKQLENIDFSEQSQQPIEENTGDVRERIERVQRAMQEKSQLDGKLQDSSNAFQNNLLKNANEDFVQYLLNAQKKIEQEYQLVNAKRLMPVLENMLQLLQDQQYQLLEQGRNYSQALSSFFVVFRDLNRRISEQSRRLSKEVADDLQLEGIQKSEVRIQSTIDELDFWQPLKHFHKLNEEWQKSDAPFPSDQYLNVLSDVVDLLKNDQSFNFENLLRLELHLTEGGSDLVIRNDRQLLESSSHGMAYLILCKFLLAFTRLLRGNAQIAIHWPIDEIGTLAYRNVEKLFNACQANNIYIVGAFPNPESDVLMLFKNRYLIEKQAITQSSQLKRIEPQLSRLSQRLQALEEAR